MPFEAGLAIALNFSGLKHECAFFEAKVRRLQKSLSDLNGYDPYIHYGKVKGVLLELTNLFQMTADVDQLFRLYRLVSQGAVIIKKKNGNDLFCGSAFRQLVAQSQDSAKDLGYIPP